MTKKEINEINNIEKIYYDLIELPSGSHIPVPIAIRLVGEKNIKKISVSRKIRDDTFFYCEECGETSFYKCFCETNTDIDYDDLQEQYQIKELAFVDLINKKKHHLLKYIKADD